MRQVSKMTEPASLTQYRRTGGTTWDAYREKQDAREALNKEQRRICAFCQGRIRPSEGDMKIAHVVPQSDLNDGVRLCLHWGNMVGACKGGEGRPQAEQHCDTLQGSRRIPALLHPVNFQSGVIKYSASGQMTSDVQEVRQAIDNTLGLNTKHLKQNRLSALTALKHTLPEQANSGVIAANIRRLEDSHRTELPEYVDFLLWWLRKRYR